MCGTDVRCWADGARGGAHHSALSLSESRNGGESEDEGLVNSGG